MVATRKPCRCCRRNIAISPTTLSRRLFPGSWCNRPSASPVVRFGQSAFCRARALLPKLFQATLLVFLQPAYLRTMGCGRSRTPRRNRHTSVFPSLGSLTFAHGYPFLLLPTACFNSRLVGNCLGCQFHGGSGPFLKFTGCSIPPACGKLWN